MNNPQQISVTEALPIDNSRNEKITVQAYRFPVQTGGLGKALGIVHAGVLVRSSLEPTRAVRVELNESHTSPGTANAGGEGTPLELTDFPLPKDTTYGDEEPITAQQILGFKNCITKETKCYLYGFQTVCTSSALYCANEHHFPPKTLGFLQLATDWNRKSITKAPWFAPTDAHVNRSDQQNQMEARTQNLEKAKAAAQRPESVRKAMERQTWYGTRSAAEWYKRNPQQ